MKLLPYTIQVDGTLIYKGDDGCMHETGAGMYNYQAFIMLQLEAGYIPWFIHPAVWHYDVPVIDGSRIT